MKKLFGILFLIILLNFIFGCQNQPEEAVKNAVPIADVEADKEAIKVLVEHFFAAHESGDLDGLMVTFTDDAIFMPQGAGTVDKKAARERFSPSFEHFSLAIESSIDEVAVSDNWGFARCSYRLKATPKAKGEEILYDGKFIFILKRQSDNSWRSSHFIWNSNTPPPETE
ncbi:MAG: nuclear transport factor 2 family protein [Candidatus Aminicenantes bacterium]|nr:MAG: nuclear transport factor 2 family protein [Candidatus Aminicenantes bacterium]